MAKVKLKEVEVPDAPVRMIWVEPASLAEHPDNWKIHTEQQTAVVGDLIQRHGWLVPLTYNLTTGRLLNGHDRRKLAIARGIPAVPVLVGNWDKESEPEILAALDQSGQMFETDPKALEKLIAKVGDTTEAIDQLMDALKAENGLEESRGFTPAARPEPEFTADPDPVAGGGSAPAASPAPDSAPPPSHVRMVQLFLNTDTFPQFYDMVQKLAPEYGTANPTDTVMECLRRASDGVPGPDGK